MLARPCYVIRLAYKVVDMTVSIVPTSSLISDSHSAVVSFALGSLDYDSYLVAYCPFTIVPVPYCSQIPLYYVISYKFPLFA